MNKRRFPRQRGFTLIEVIISLAITAVIMTFSYQAFSTASRSAEATKEVMTNINRLDRTWQILGKDLRHLLAPIDASDDPTITTGVRRPFRGASLYDDTSGDQLLLQMTRSGWLNPMNRARSDIQQIIYRVSDGVLWRDYRPERNFVIEDWLFAEDLIKQEMLTDIHSIELKFLSAARAGQQGTGVLDGDDFARDWDELWPATDSAGIDTSLPIAVLIRIELEDGLISERLYDLSS
ncbi:type II secretion system minor pseudopilin GspJ [Gilvimarinus agarilyticus]|uniref:type II secretion system minor pseudopilin GspJ n=1 Tax=Gilvimarinus sp. 2_MG-2023 TaxID=3062666 RepID=UPI001C081869|nr:type II secretion system minor pseudopilin GspJ [Gilvimarinus sp. 2_MG-2023]MBU2886244.1 type II secretion system minor pseudopilin GspJ [Gilvimarinus agarilyticus]MDO6570932.1 type II secretion system minor pseudopilin GspJ [Gilvimarinus sp. 2_MG-2023]